MVDLPEPESPMSARLPARELEADTGDDLVVAVGDGEVAHAQQRAGARGRRGAVEGQFVLRSHRLILFTERTVAIVTSAGAQTSQGASG